MREDNNGKITEYTYNGFSELILRRNRGIFGRFFIFSLLA